MLVIGAGATGVQVASIFNAFGTEVTLFQAGARVVPAEDEDVSLAVAAGLRESGITVRENFGSVERFEKTRDGVRMHFSREQVPDFAEATLAVVAIGWVADTAGLCLAEAGVETDAKGCPRVDNYLQTSASHVFAAGDVTGRLMLAPQAMQDGFVAATNAMRAATQPLWSQVSPIGSFTDPEYAQVGFTEKKARESHDVVVVTVPFDSTIRTIIDGRTTGFCKLIVNRPTRQVLGCHVVGERAVEITQVAAIVIAGGMLVDELAQVPLSFPTYTAILSRAAYLAADQIMPSRRGTTFSLA
jgi:pyruvate/2-oxoglutarate dehydrogenase complex dihydrolipoamide dehydrogenase (E3) component